jgi:hypothetical protein
MEFDPLKASEEFDTEIASAAKKRQIKNILKSYVGLYDSFSELIQNSMDAVDKMAELSDDNYEKIIWIKIDLVNNYFSITDNGIGFNKKEFEAFLAPNISFKDGRNTRGNKGVGATYIAYGFNYLQLGTKHPEFEFTGEINNGRTWVEDKEGIVTRPTVKKSETLHELFNQIPRGSTFTIRYGGDSTRPKNLKYFIANTAEQWLYLLLLKTPLGCINFFEKKKNDIIFEIKVIDQENKEHIIGNQKAEYIYPHLKVSATANLKDIIAAQNKMIEQGKDASKLPPRYEKLNGIYEYYSSTELKHLPTTRLTDPDKELIDNFQIEAYGFFSYSTSLWDEFNDKLAKLRKGFRILKGGLLLANNCMIQGDYLSIPLTSNTGYQNQVHIIVHMRDADPDLGRKGFQPELKEIGETISVGIVNRLKRWKTKLRNDTGSAPMIAPQISLHNWIRDQEKYEENYPISLFNPNFFNPIHEISISSVPQSEQDVIVLFNQLIAGGVIRGIKLLATSQYEKYDGIFRFYVKEPAENHIFDTKKNPLGVQSLGLPIGTISQPNVLEYKYCLDALFQEFENEEKFEKDINLAVAWKLGSNWKKNYEVTSLLDLDNLHHRPFHGITHIIHSQTSKFYAIILNELLDYLNNVDSVQNFHRNEYGNDPFN